MGWESLGAIASIGADLVSTKYSSDLQHKENKTSRRWQENLAKNAHQFEVADLEAAGLNPLLSGGGGGLNTPSASSVNTPQLDIDVNSALATGKILADTNEATKRAELQESQKQTQDAITEVQRNNAITSGIEARRAKDADDALRNKPGANLAFRLGDKTVAGQMVTAGGSLPQYIKDAVSPSHSAFDTWITSQAQKRELGRNLKKLDDQKKEKQWIKNSIEANYYKDTWPHYEPER